MESTELTFTCSKSIVETAEKRCEICSKLTIKTPERGTYVTPFSTVCYDFKQVNVS